MITVFWKERLEVVFFCFFIFFYLFLFQMIFMIHRAAREGRGHVLFLSIISTRITNTYNTFKHYFIRQKKLLFPNTFEKYSKTKRKFIVLYSVERVLKFYGYFNIFSSVLLTYCILSNSAALSNSTASLIIPLDFFTFKIYYHLSKGPALRVWYSRVWHRP